MIMVGSRAFLHQIGDDPWIKERIKKSDYDVVMTYSEFKAWREDYYEYIEELYPTKQRDKFTAMINYNGKKMQYEIEVGMANNSSQWLLDNREEACEGAVKGFFGEEYHCLKLEYSLWTKRSHLRFPVHFRKNINDYHAIKEAILKKNDEIPETKKMLEYHYLRLSEAGERNNIIKERNEVIKIPTLTVDELLSKEEIHNAIKIYNRSFYDLIGSIISFREIRKFTYDSLRFFKLPYEKQIECVQEELYAICIQHFIMAQINTGKIDAYNIEWYKRSIELACTELFGGWFSDFIIDNYPTLIENYNTSFFDRFVQATKDKLNKEFLQQ